MKLFLFLKPRKRVQALARRNTIAQAITTLPGRHALAMCVRRTLDCLLQSEEDKINKFGLCRAAHRQLHMKFNTITIVRAFIIVLDFVENVRDIHLGDLGIAPRRISPHEELILPIGINVSRFRNDVGFKHKVDLASLILSNPFLAYWSLMCDQLANTDDDERFVTFGHCDQIAKQVFGEMYDGATMRISFLGLQDRARRINKRIRRTELA